MFGIEPVPVEVRPSAGLDTISEEGAAVGTPQPERPGRAGIAGLGLLFLLALQAETALPCMNELPVGEMEHLGIGGPFNHNPIVPCRLLYCCAAAAAGTYDAKLQQKGISLSSAFVANETVEIP